MTKKLIGTCPCCGGEIAIALSPFLGLPTGIPHKCGSCETLLQVSPKQPKLSRFLKMATYIALYTIFWFYAWSLAFLWFGVFAYLVVSYWVNRTVGRPTLTVFVPERDFLKEELADDKDLPK